MTDTDAAAEMRVTVTYATVEQLLDELQSMKFAGFGQSEAWFATTGGRILTVTASRPIPQKTDVQRISEALGRAK